jgi:hypothetical protein
MPGTASSVVTYTIENILFIAILTGTCLFASHYISVIRLPPVAFMFVGVESVLITLQTVVMLIIFSTRHKTVDGAFADSLLSHVSQGFTVMSCLMWVGTLACVFVEVPLITSVVGFPSSASIASLAVVIGFSVVIPLLALTVTYAALPEGEINSLVFNGSTLGATSLLFFVLVSYGSGGVSKCSPYDGAGTSTTFFGLVLTYWTLLYLIEIAVHYKFSPLTALWNNLVGGGDGDARMMNQDGFVGPPKAVSITFWRIPGGVLNVVTVISALGYSDQRMRYMILVFAVVIAILHVPLIITLDIDAFFSMFSGSGDEMNFPMVQNAFVNPPTNYTPMYNSVGPPMAAPMMGPLSVANPSGLPSQSRVFGDQMTPQSDLSVFSKPGVRQRPFVVK